MTHRARPRDLRLLPVALITWIVSAVSVHHPTHAFWLAPALFGVAVAVIVAGSRPSRSSVGERRTRYRAAGALVAVGCAFGAVAVAHVAAALPVREAVAALPVAGGRSISVDGVVIGKIERSHIGQRFDALTVSLRVGDMRAVGAVPIVVSAPATPARLDLGATFHAEGTGTATRSGDRAVVMVHATEISLRAPPVGIFAATSELRRGLQSQAASLPSPGAALIAGLAVGDTSAVGADLDTAMKSASLSHLTAVSGANCALVVGLSLGVAAAAGLGRRARLATGVIVLAGFIFLVTPEPSVVRAGAMALIAMVATLAGRTGAGAAVLCLAVILSLIADPWLSMSAGFALSAAATGALLLLAGPLADGLRRWMPSPLAIILAVPLSTHLVCSPLIVLFEPRVSLYGVLANLVAGPAAPAATVVGLLACLVGPIAPVVASGLAAIAWVPASWIAQTAITVAGFPGATIPWAEGALGLLGLVVLGGAIVVAVHRATPRRLRAATTLVLSAALGVLVALGAGSAILDRLRTPSSWSVVACAVGQGDAVLLRSGGRAALIDTGPEPQPLTRCLDRFGVDRIDLLVLTHFDLDHRGGVDAVIGRVDTVLHGPVPESEDAEDAAATVSALRRGGAHLVRAETGMRGDLGEARWRILWPDAGPSAAPAGNDASVVVEVAGGGIPRSLFLGDLSAEPQVRVSPRTTGTYDIVKVAHHGSADQYAPLYDRLHARIALFTVGENTYGHPRAEALDILAGTGARILRTDTSGDLAVWYGDDGDLRFWRDRATPASDPASAASAPVGRLETWQHADRHPAPRQPSHSSRGGRRSPPPSCSSRVRRKCAQSVRSPASATICAPRIPAWRSLIFALTTTAPDPSSA